MRILVGLLVGHAVLLMLASTNFTMVSWLWGDFSPQWSYFQCSHRSGWGISYVSEFGLGQVLCYLAAYGLGLAAFILAFVRYRLGLSAVAAVLCLAGAVSFGIEATHWLWNHHCSWIASFPVVMVVLWAGAGIQLCRIGHE